MNNTLPCLLKSQNKQRQSLPAINFQEDDLTEDIMNPRVKDILNKHPDLHTFLDSAHNLEMKQQQL